MTNRWRGCWRLACRVTRLSIMGMAGSLWAAESAAPAVSTSPSNASTVVALTYTEVPYGVNNEGVSMAERAEPFKHEPTSTGKVIRGTLNFGGTNTYAFLWRYDEGKLALDLNRHESIGIDLVAMCVNDLVVCGAEPLFFLDYYATGHLNIDTAATVMTGIGEGCLQAGCALVGGETAEMPGMYHGEDYDLAGFCTGVVEKSEIIDGSRVKAGDVLIGVASSGVHSNGYSLVRKIIDVSKADLGSTLDGRVLADVLMTPTRIYVKSLLALIASMPVHAMAHITGGGLPGNLPRVLPEGADARVDENSWTWPPVFQWLQEKGGVERFEMYRTFNCGVGMVVVVAAGNADAAIAQLNAAGEQAWRLGEIIASTHDEPTVVFN